MIDGSGEEIDRIPKDREKRIEHLKKLIRTPKDREKRIEHYVIYIPIIRKRTRP